LPAELRAKPSDVARLKARESAGGPEGKEAMTVPAEVWVYYRVIEIPTWLEVLTLAGVVVTAVCATVAIWRARRRKGPPPLPHP
jgi:hypothetical protein